MTAKMLLLLLLLPPLAVTQFTPTGHERFHFFFAVARGVAGAAVEVGDEVAFLVDAYILSENQHHVSHSQTMAGRYYSPSLLAPVSLV